VVKKLQIRLAIHGKEKQQNGQSDIFHPENQVE
jgi:hypothetical protein